MLTEINSWLISIRGCPSVRDSILRFWGELSRGELFVATHLIPALYFSYSHSHPRRC